MAVPLATFYNRVFDEMGAMIAEQGAGAEANTSGILAHAEFRWDLVVVCMLKGLWGEANTSVDHNTGALRSYKELYWQVCCDVAINVNCGGPLTSSPILNLLPEPKAHDGMQKDCCFTSIQDSTVL
jgi:hypothetical protein